MRVISKYKDFYDSAGFIDQSVIFVRNREEKEVDIKHPLKYSSTKGAGLLGFCGKFYPYIYRCIDSYTEQYTEKIIPTQHYYFYSFEEYKETKFWANESHSRYFWNRKSAIKDYTDFFAHWKDTDAPFLELDAPYFKVSKFSSDSRNDRGEALTNPSLIDMQFGKIMDAPTVFQTVQFYLTNQLVKTKDPDEIEDKYRLANHGFDKYSFRHPTKLKDLK